jgi:MHS family proline/betaine transporter-like MFS transporter
LIRCAQGFSAGGEYAGACAYLMEHAPQHKRAWYGSFVPVSTFSAFAAAAIMAYALDASLSPEAMSSWGWRLPFLIAAPLGLVGLYLRWRLGETPAFQAVAEEDAVAHSPLKDTLRNHGAAICCLGAFVSLTALSFYMFTTYFATYLQVAGGLSRATALLVSLIALVFAAAICPLAGAYSDRVGRRMTVLSTCVLLIVVVYPSFLMASSGSFVASIIGVMLLAIGAVLCGVVTAALLSETFPTRTRYTASAITYNMAYTIFGGTAPLMATWLISTTGSNLSPAFYLIVIALLALAGGMALPETSKISLHDIPSGEKGVPAGSVI